MGTVSHKNGPLESFAKPTIENLLLLSGITKRFPGVLALDHVDLEVKSGEIHGLMGENGAGKSTLIKILTGAYQPDAGDINFDGQHFQQLNPRKAMAIGIACIYQELNLIPHLTIAENIFLGREIHFNKHLAILDRKKMFFRAKQLFEELQLNLDPKAKTGSLGIGHQQMVEICKAVNSSAKLILMDEPTSSLSEKEAEDLFRIMRQLKSRGVTILFISHRLDEVKQMCDQVTILRDGRSVTKLQMTESSVDDIVKHMVGRDIKNKYPKVKATIGAELLSIQGLNRKAVLHDISFNLREGEVLGFAGLVGAGRTETARAITGADPIDSGTIRIYGQPIRIKSPSDSIKAGIAFLTEDRKSQGLILIQDIVFNATLVKLHQHTKFGFMKLKSMRQMTEKLAGELKIRANSVATITGKLSGGNQQKVVIAKWLQSQARIFIFDEPTRGIDVGAKVEVYNLINQLVARGAGVIIICSEMDEVMGMADRILVMHEGQITAEFTQAEATQEKIMWAASGYTSPPTAKTTNSSTEEIHHVKP